MSVFEMGCLVSDRESRTVVLVTHYSGEGRPFFSGTTLIGRVGEHHDDWLVECFEPFVGTISLVGEVK